MTAPTDSVLEDAAQTLEVQSASLAARIRSWKAGTPTPPPSTDPDPRLWAPAFSDDFSASTLNTRDWWAPYDRVPGTAGVGTRKSSLASFRDGQLVIAAERPSATNKDWNSWFSTGVAAGPHAQTYGRWEIRASASDGAGFWPNMQLWPTAGLQPGYGPKEDGWSNTIEIDIFESPIRTRDKAYFTVHYGSNNTQKSVSYDADFNQFNTWIVEWTPLAIDAYLNGKQIVHITNKAQIPTTPHHFVAQTDMGEWAGTPTSKDPTRMELILDYVKQWNYVGS